MATGVGVPVMMAANVGSMISDLTKINMMQK